MTELSFSRRTVDYSLHRESELAGQGELVVGGVGYYPLYEIHSVGPKAPLLPSTAGLFCEGFPEGPDRRFDGAYTLPPAELITYLAAANPVSGGIIERVLDSGATVAVGDAVSFFAFAKAILTSPKEKAAGRRNDLLGTLALVLPFLKLRQERMAKPSRRHFLKVAAVASAAVGLHLLASGQRVKNLTMSPYGEADRFSPPIQKAAERITARINGLVSHFNPQDYVIFSRNLLFALKTKMLGDYLKSEMVNQRPRVAFLVGANHAGMEDFLCLPLPVLRQMLIRVGGLDLYYSALEVGGATNFATVRLIKRAGGEYTDLKLVDADLKKELMAAYPI